MNRELPSGEGLPEPGAPAHLRVAGVGAASFEVPRRLTSSAWVQHGPFAFWIVDALRPRTIVELGSHTGYSFLCFCQAVATFGFDCRAWAVDTWSGDEHAGFYGESIHDALRAYCELHYPDVATLLRMTFDEAAGRFSPATIDLLHIDGRHYYEDVRTDFETWRPMLSDRGVVLFHDTQVRDRGFGVHRLFRELREQFAGFEFTHGNGLGVLLVGHAVPRPLVELVEDVGDTASLERLRRAYEALGVGIAKRLEVQNLRAEVRDLEAVCGPRDRREALADRLAALTTERDHALGSVAELRRQSAATLGTLMEDRAALERRMERAQDQRRELKSRLADVDRRLRRLRNRTRNPLWLWGHALLETVRWPLRPLAPAATRLRDWSFRRRWMSRIRDARLFDEAHYSRQDARLDARRDRGRRGARGDLLRHYLAKGAARGLSPHPAFDGTYYVDRLGGSGAGRPDPNEVLIDYLRRPDRADPHPLFRSAWYRATAVPGADVAALAHYLTLGWRAGLDPNPFFDGRWYRARYALADDVEPFGHWLSEGRMSGNLPCPWWEPDWWRVREGVNLADDALLVRLLDRYADPGDQRLRRVLLDLVAFLLEIGELERAEAVCAHRLGRAPADYGHNAGLALARLRAVGWQASRPLWEDLWRRVHDGATQVDGDRKALTVNARGLMQAVEREAEPKAADTSTSGLRVALYTSLIGDYDDLPPVLGAIDGIDCVCFTDRERFAPGWRQVRVTPDSDDGNLAAKRFKVFPWEYLPEADASLFVDANTLVRGRVDHFLARWCHGRPFVMWRHPDRVDPFQEAEAVLLGMRHAPGPIIDQIDAYATAGLPQGSGLFEASFLWRDHRSAAVRTLMENWWREICSRSRRDQLSLAYLMWRDGPRPEVLPNALGTSRSNSVLVKLEHRHGPVPGIVSGSSASGVSSAMRSAGTRTRLQFVIEPKYRNSGATFMRGFQLCDLVAPRIARECDAEVVEGTEGLAQGLLWLTKGALKEARPETLDQLRDRGCRLVADYVDDIAREELDPFIDCYIASSIAGFETLARRFGASRVHHVTHHADPRVPQGSGRADSTAIGYFGETANAFLFEGLTDRVEIVRVNTRKSDDGDWFGALGKFGVHYAVRKRREFDGDKPFLKGFTAARCGVPIIVGRADGDAEYYLGEDYPFFVDTVEPASVRAVIDRVQAGPHTSDWECAMAAMESVRRRSSDEHVAGEVRALLCRFGCVD